MTAYQNQSSGLFELLVSERNPDAFKITHHLTVATVDKRHSIARSITVNFAQENGVSNALELPAPVFPLYITAFIKMFDEFMEKGEVTSELRALDGAHVKDIARDYADAREWGQDVVTERMKIFYGEEDEVIVAYEDVPVMREHARVIPHDVETWVESLPVKNENKVVAAAKQTNTHRPNQPPSGVCVGIINADNVSEVPLSMFDMFDMAFGQLVIPLPSGIMMQIREKCGLFPSCEKALEMLEEEEGDKAKAALQKTPSGWLVACKDIFGNSHFEARVTIYSYTNYRTAGVEEGVMVVQDHSAAHHEQWRAHLNERAAEGVGLLDTLVGGDEKPFLFYQLAAMAQRELLGLAFLRALNVACTVDTQNAPTYEACNELALKYAHTRSEPSLDVFTEPLLWTRKSFPGEMPFAPFHIASVAIHVSASDAVISFETGMTKYTRSVYLATAESIQRGAHLIESRDRLCEDDLWIPTFMPPTRLVNGSGTNTQRMYLSDGTLMTSERVCAKESFAWDTVRESLVEAHLHPDVVVTWCAPFLGCAKATVEKNEESEIDDIFF